MSGDRYLVDTNVFIALLNKHPSVSSFFESDWYFSFISEIELLGKPGIKANDAKTVRELLSICNKVVHSEVINQLTIEIKQKLKIKLPDALIAATSIHYDIPLLTFDKDFSKVNHLNLILLE
jgi:predicted nucleic acid-binding protein